MQRVSLNVFAAVLSSVVLLGLSSVAVDAGFSPNPNPNNRGNHYGWFKRNQTPAPVPGPAPAPAPGGSGDHASGGGTHTGVGLGGAIPQLNLEVLKLVPTRQNAEANVSPIEQPRSGDPWWWLILLLVPTLAALWAIAFRRLAVGSEGRRRSAGVAGAPAL